MPPPRPQRGTDTAIAHVSYVFSRWTVQRAPADLWLFQSRSAAMRRCCASVVGVLTAASSSVPGLSPAAAGPPSFWPFFLPAGGRGRDDEARLAAEPVAPAPGRRAPASAPRGRASPPGRDHPARTPVAGATAGSRPTRTRCLRPDSEM